jgi:hypothetical protein
VLRAELDAYYAHLYGLNRKQLRYILDPADLTEKELEDILDLWEEVSDPLDPAGYAERCAQSDFPGETFRVLKEKEIRQYGEYRTRRLVLEAWERLEGGALTPAPSPAGGRGEPEQPAKPNSPEKSPAKVVKEIDPPAGQPTFTDFGLYKCGVCGKLVMGYEKAIHEREIHDGKRVEWRKVR